jgi:hypothetical protein
MSEKAGTGGLFPEVKVAGALKWPFVFMLYLECVEIYLQTP